MIRTAVEAAGIGGAILRKAFQSLDREQIRLKGTGDYVTDLDHQSEEAIVSFIKSRYPGHSFLAEEAENTVQKTSYQWVIDPLDGTANYVQGIPAFAVSIALLEENQPVLGVVYNPILDELFTAEKGKGAFLNSRSISVSGKENVKRAMLATGFPWRSREFIDPYLATFETLLLDTAGIRRMGAAAIDLAYTACGRFDAFWEMKLKPWDIAAGILLVGEAGGIVTDFLGGPDVLRSGNVAAGTPVIQKHLVSVTQKNLSRIP